MKRFALIVLVAMIISGCSSTLPRTVEIPVAVPCSPPPIVDRPHLAINTLQPNSLPAEVIRAYAESLEQVTGYAEQLETILNGYLGRWSCSRPSASRSSGDSRRTVHRSAFNPQLNP